MPSVRPPPACAGRAAKHDQVIAGAGVEVQLLARCDSDINLVAGGPAFRVSAVGVFIAVEVNDGAGFRPFEAQGVGAALTVDGGGGGGGEDERGVVAGAAVERRCAAGIRERATDGEEVFPLPSRTLTFSKLRYWRPKAMPRPVICSWVNTPSVCAVAWALSSTTSSSASLSPPSSVSGRFGPDHRSAPVHLGRRR